MAQRGGAIVQGHVPVSDFAKWRRVVLDPATKAIFQTTFRWQHTITYARQRFWQIYWPPECWCGGCVLYIGLQIFTLWQKCKVGDLGCLLYSMVYYIRTFTVGLETGENVLELTLPRDLLNEESERKSTLVSKLFQMCRMKNVMAYRSNYFCLSEL